LRALLDAAPERYAVIDGGTNSIKFHIAERAVDGSFRKLVDRADLSRIEGRPAPDLLVAMGGAVTNIAAVKHALRVYNADIVQGTVLDRVEIDRQIELYRSRNAAQRRAIVDLQPKRAEIILAGACIVRSVMDKLHQNILTVSDRGLRHGLLIERFGT